MTGTYTLLNACVMVPVSSRSPEQVLADAFRAPASILEHVCHGPCVLHVPAILGDAKGCIQLLPGLPCTATAHDLRLALRAWELKEHRTRKASR